MGPATNRTVITGEVSGTRRELALGTQDVPDLQTFTVTVHTLSNQEAPPPPRPATWCSTQGDIAELPTQRDTWRLARSDRHRTAADWRQSVKIQLTKIQQVKLPVSDLQRSVTWYRSLLGLDLGWEFVEQGVVRGAVLVDRESGFLIGLRDRAVIPGSPSLAGFDAFSLGVPSVDALHALADHCDQLGYAHGDLLDRGVGGWQLDVPDPDDTIVRFLSPLAESPFGGVEFFPDGSTAFYDKPRLNTDTQVTENQ
ncbi:MAG TPA: VOC family protein [Actinokineospora sp.]|nr:VOC family protein [Actinokineospora sp.]